METTSLLKENTKQNLALRLRKIIISDEIDECGIIEAISYLYRLMERDKILKKIEPIEILINTVGGSVYDGLALISLIESMKEQGYIIKTINMRKAFSMGFIISLVGSERIAYRHSFYMFHDISSGWVGKSAELKDVLEQIEMLNEEIKNILREYTYIPEELINSVIDHKKDYYFSAKEALKYSIADKIV